MRIVCGMILALQAACAFARMHENAPCLSSAWLYPQMDMELFRVHQMRDDVRRAGLYAYHPGVVPPLRDKAEFRRVCAEDDPLPEAFRRISETHYDSAEGRRYVTVDGGLMGGGAIRSAETNWEARVFDGSWRPVAAYPDAHRRPYVPHGRDRFCRARSRLGLYRLGEAEVQYGDPNETGDGRYAFYGRPWAKSLCHVWSAWPAFIFVSEGLGIRPTADGWRTWSHRPLPGCGNLKAEIPTPDGILRLGGKESENDQ